jgi:hypothetical protein
MENLMRIFGAAILAASLLVTNAFAATLPVGKPAGVKKAQAENHNMLLIIGGIGLAGLGIALAASSNGGGPTSVSTAAIGTGTGSLSPATP